MIAQGNRFILQETLLNIAMLFPVGLLLPCVYEHPIPLWKILAFVLGVTVSIEIIQLITARGLFELDDIIHNTIGGCVGGMIGNFIISWKNRK